MNGLSFSGSCHCGAMAVTFETGKSPEALPLRACACSFCRKHGVRTTSDPDGRIRIELRDAGKVNRYRFALGTADYLVCRECGAYVAAVHSDAATGRAWAIVNVHVLDDRSAFDRKPMTVDYDRETATERMAPRKVAWTPAEVVESYPAGKGRSG